jgi:PAS domain S-box-containing protein
MAGWVWFIMGDYPPSGTDVKGDMLAAPSGRDPGAGPSAAGERLRNLVTYSQDGILLTDESGILTEWSPAMEKISGLGRSEVIGRPFWEIHHAVLPGEKKHQVSSAVLQALFNAAVVNGTSPWLEQNGETEIERPDKTRRIIEASDFLISAGKGTMIGAIIRDVTERKRNEFLEREANRKLNLMSSITRHDINNQLTILTGYLTLLEQGSTVVARDQIFRTIKGSSTKIQRILEFTKEYQNVGVKSPVWQDLGRTVALAMSTIETGPVKMTMEPLCRDIEIFADPLLSRVFYNLIDNSLRHGETATEIRFFCHAHGEDLYIVYEDNGIGIPEKIRPVLFERGKGRNTGYGMFLIREILTITGFTIAETGKTGSGTRFEIKIPPGSFRSRAINGGHQHICGMPDT